MLCYLIPLIYKSCAINSINPFRDNFIHFSGINRIKPDIILKCQIYQFVLLGTTNSNI